MCISKNIYDKIVRLPIHTKLDDKDIKIILNNIKFFFNNINESKLFLIIYIILFIFLIIFFSKYNINDLQSNFNKLEEIKKNYFILFIFITFIFSIVISFLGFSLPVIILNGIIHGNLYGFLNTLVSLTVGSYLFYIFYYNANPQQIYQIFKKRFKN